MYRIRRTVAVATIIEIARNQVAGDMSCPWYASPAIDTTRFVLRAGPGHPNLDYFWEDTP
jgi:hypothetical protein